jgi:hypothetical protein
MRSSHLVSFGPLADTRTVRKDLRQRDGLHADHLTRSFVQFDGGGETANARQREIGGHAAVLLRGLCLRKKPDSPYAPRQEQRRSKIATSAPLTFVWLASGRI